jgi:predicted RNA-binding Zn-ribbon protein involved in translation (DUF1610 family)
MGERMKVEISLKQYGVSGGTCTGCGKDTRHLYKHESYPRHKPRCSRCMDKLKKVVNKLKCPKCGSEYIQATRLENHLQLNHGFSKSESLSIASAEAWKR